MKNKGFTLIELMIVVAIVGIITSIAYPTYMGFVKNGTRSAAQSDLMALAAAMQRHKAANFSYEGAADGGANTGAPAVFHAHSPSSEPVANKQYSLTISTVTGNGTSYLLLATPVSGTAQASDGKLYYFSDGRKGWDKNNDGTLGNAEYCWKC
ncbi:type IV pilin protein [Alteromonadaceae bacterium BrNp21-10]|nr:type IV pilin protein [Alteromonadaceae bacterium BrNp21-10]